MAKFESIIHNSGRRLKKLWTDRGAEFYNASVARVLRDNDTQLFSTHNEPNATIAERFIRTLREKIEYNYVLRQSTVWIDILPSLLHQYNTSVHRTIKMTPERSQSTRKPTATHADTLTNETDTGTDTAIDPDFRRQNTNQ